jgi:hypothetical protein
MISKTGNAAHDATLLAAESTRQSAVAAAASQATANSATVTFYRACLASKITNGLDAGQRDYRVEKSRCDRLTASKETKGTRRW